MITLLHLADLHIGVENYGRPDPESGLHTRLLDYLARLDQAIEIGIRAGCDLVLIAGDIYKNRTPNPTHQREFARRLRRIHEAGIPVVILTGNHDASPAAGRAHSVEIFETLDVEGVTIVDRPRVLTIQTRSGPVQIIALPWVTRHNLLTREEMRLATMLEVETMLLQRIERFLLSSADGLDPQIPAVLTLHGTIDGASLGAEQQIMLGKDMVLPRSLVALPNIDYVALGHIHKHQALGEHPPIVYPGSIERIDFGEEREDKGCVLVELDKGRTRWRFVPLDARPFITLTVDIRGSSAPEQRITDAIAKRALSGAIVRARIQALPEQTGNLNTDTIQKQLEEAGAFAVAAVAIEVERGGRGRLAGYGDHILEGLTPRKALELYLREKKPPFSEERITQLLAAAEELFGEIER